LVARAAVNRRLELPAVHVGFRLAIAAISM
jgi:hypothetical protein